jgi:hypothetical protein
VEEFKTIGKQYQDYIKAAERGEEANNADILEALTQFGNLLEALMIRRTMSSSVR